MVAPQPAPWSAQQSVASRTIASHIASERHNRRIEIRQNTLCTVSKSHGLNVHFLDQPGLLNGVLDNTLNGNGSPDAQQTHQGARPGCNNSVAGRS
ncbi:hypothetical protein [Streptomyces albicerus]|uniref:hypothetical protein n=1 Tax=Streptomyces albicerus TaxID=2569859 RepID=UPI00124B50AA|nr:hypothetical protein [Streptomyces albicerus]